MRQTTVPAVGRGGGWFLVRAGGAMVSEVTGSPVVMLVEDFQDTREMMRHMLELSGCRVVEAANGQEAIELSQQGGLDLVLMDLNMPVLDGFTATLRIREYERTRDVPVVAVTAYDTAEFRAAADAVGCCDYVVKPLDLERLDALLKQLLPSRDNARAAQG
ncbi:MAG: response regulator [Acidobacteria bacterium]|nr:MAG: response regulator [Acidobacteriota bacterium]PYS81616.1 MAG: response regulator [Acidobacteriota bacterium]